MKIHASLLITHQIINIKSVVAKKPPLKHYTTQLVSNTMTTHAEARMMMQK